MKENPVLKYFSHARYKEHHKVNEARTGRAHFQRVTLYMQIWSLASVYFETLATIAQAGTV